MIKMEHCTPSRITAFALLLVLYFLWQSESIFAIDTSPCSCYSFKKSKRNWEDSNNYCKQMKGNMVSMETEEEYQFIDKMIQSLNEGNNEWYIGLSKDRTGDWKWISGHSMTIRKWLPREPSGSEGCVKMIKHYKGRGLFDDIACRTLNMFICEYNEAQSCSFINNKWCFLQPNLRTTKETTAPTQATTTQRTHSYSSTRSHKKSTALISSSTENEQQTKAVIQTTKPEGDVNDDAFPLVTVTFALGAVLALSVCVLVFVCCWKWRNRGHKNVKPRSETTSLPRDAMEMSPNKNQGPEDRGLTEDVQLFHQNVGESYVAYAVIHNNLTQQNQGTTAFNEPAYDSIEDEKMMKRSSKNDPIAAMPAATMNGENSGNSVGGNRSTAEVVYSSIDKKKKNNKKNEDQDGKQWPTGQQVVYASVDKSKKSKACAEDVVYAEVGSKKNTGKQQPYQITYAELADFTHDAPREAVKPAPYQSAEYAVIIGQKEKS